MDKNVKKAGVFFQKLMPVLVVFLLLVLIYALSSNSLGLPSMSGMFYK